MKKQGLKKRTSMKVFTVLRYILLGGILGYLVAEAVIHGFFNRYARVPAVHALCPFEAFGNFLNTLTGLKFFSNPFAAASVFLLFLILLAILLNRVFCGFLCAFGALQEFVGDLGTKVLKKRPTIPEKLDKVLHALKYVFLILSVLLAFLTGYEFFGNLFAHGSDAFSSIDPWIAFKSLFSNNFLVGGYISSLVVLVLSLVGSFFFQRFYCKYICPLGGLFAIFGSLSGLHVFRNVKHEETAEEAVCDGSCAACAMNCGGDTTVKPIKIANEDAENAEKKPTAEVEAEPEAAAEEEPKTEHEADADNDKATDVQEDDEPYEDEEEEEKPKTVMKLDNYCTGCGKCSEVCPMGIDVANVDGNVDFAECIACQKCVAACPEGALQTKYFKKKTHPIWILVFTFIIFFVAVFAFNFIKIDRGGRAPEPIYDSIRLAPVAPDDGTFAVKDIMYDLGMTLDELKGYYSLSDNVTEKSSYSEYYNSYTLKYFKNNDEERYKDILMFFKLPEDTPLDLSLGEIYNDAPISVTAEYIGFDPEKINEFADYFGAKPEDKFETISKRYYELYDAYTVFAMMDETEWSNYIASYGYWYQCSYGPKLVPAKNFYELCAECEYEKSLAPLMVSDKFTINYLLETGNMTLSEFIERYHVKEGSITTRSSYSEFADAIKLSYYKEMYAQAAADGKEDEFAEMIGVYGYTPENVNLEMTVGELLESGNVKQAAKFFGYKIEEDIQKFIDQHEGATADSPYSVIHEAVNKTMDDYYDMLYAYYTSGQQMSN